MKSLGTVGFRDRGEWQTGTFYRRDDRILRERSTLYALEDHESGEEFDPQKWGFLTDARGIGEAITEAETAAGDAVEATEAARQWATEAETQSAEARKAAAAANAEAEKAKEVSGMFSENFRLTENDEFLMAVTDSDGELVWGVRTDGTVCQPKGIPEEVEKRLEMFGDFHVVESEGYLFAMADRNDNLVFGIDRKGRAIVDKLGGVCEIEQDEIRDYMLTLTDRNGNIVLGVMKDGSVRIPKGIPEEQERINERLKGRMSDLEKRLLNFKGGTGDWSESGEMRIPLPRLGMVNIISGIMPSAKSGIGVAGVTCDIPCQWEFWDRQGNYAKIWVKMSCQGNSSMAFVKKNLAIDMFRDSSFEDEYVIKFGDWVPQDSFHLKAYYTDAFRGVGVCSYKLYEEMMATRSMADDAPYKEAFTKNYGTIADEYHLNPELAENFDTGARCFPDGFPVEVYLNGEFYGIYSWQLKKHRDNYQMNKKTAEHIHLDGTLTADSIWNGNVNWEAFEIRNPKSLICKDSSKYDGDNPKEIIGKSDAGYDKTDKDKKRTASVKEAVEALSGRVGEFRAKEAEIGATAVRTQLTNLTGLHTNTSSAGLNALTSIAFIGRDEWLVYLTKDNTDTHDATLMSWINARLTAANAAEGFTAPAIGKHCVKVFENGGLVSSTVWEGLLAEAGLEGYTLDFNGTAGRVYPEGTHISLTAPTESRCYLKVVNLSEVIAAMESFLEECAVEMRALIGKYINVPFAIDYMIHAQIINNEDGFNKNWQWTTWDGEKWTVNPYDLDMSFGGYFTGNRTVAPPTGWVGNTVASPMGWVVRYFFGEMKARYAELRNRGLFDPEHVAGLVKQWCDRIGEDLFAKEYERWPESPCNRDPLLNTEYWSRKSYTNAVAVWNPETGYGNGVLVTENGKIWQSLTTANAGNRPSEDGGSHWKEVGYDATKNYSPGDTCYHGLSTVQQYLFECVKPCTGEPPFKGFYENYPRELGYYDSVYRVLRWVEARVASVDELMEYAETADLSKAGVISRAQIASIIGN